MEEAEGEGEERREERRGEEKRKERTWEGGRRERRKKWREGREIR